MVCNFINFQCVFLSFHGSLAAYIVVQDKIEQKSAGKNETLDVRPSIIFYILKKRRGK